MKTVNIKFNKDNLDYDKAKELAGQEAEARIDDPMLVSWFDREKDRHFPDVECCGCDEDPAWMIYARSRGATLVVDVNEGQYVFVYA